MAARTGLSSTIAIFRAESRCSPDVTAPWLDGSDPLPACAKFPFPADIPGCSRVQIGSPALGEARPIPSEIDWKTIVWSVGAARLPYFAADDEILARSGKVRV